MQSNIKFQQQRLLNEPTHNQRIKNLRLSRQLQFLKQSKLQYEVINLSDNQHIHNSKQTQQQMKRFYQNISYIITIKPNTQQGNNKKRQNISIYIPKNYPFQQPYYLYQNENIQNDKDQPNNKQIPQKVSQLIDWLPKYKVLQMAQLLIIKIRTKRSQQSILQRFTSYKIINSIKEYKISFIFLIALLFRVLVGLGSYSGKNDWPNLGDFQAHRNWMAITVNRPIDQWYLQPRQNIWWRIDYPPIAAYLSYIFGSIYKYIQPQAMSLIRGYESLSLSSFMRISVILIDIVFLFPAMYFMSTLQNSFSQRILNKNFSLIFFLIYALKPDLIMIDHGHFQYNSLILGLILGALYFLLNKNYYLCCILYTISIHTKQMSVYYSLAFFSALIGMTIKDNTYKHVQSKRNLIKIITQLFIYGVIVISVSLLIWMPFLTTNSAKLVIEAIFPIHRGLYQLKVQNFWCISDVFMKWQSRFSKQILMILCMIISILLSIPSMIVMIISPQRKSIILGFFTISLTFFLFSYHVHQKSILLPFLMIPLLGQYFGFKFILQLLLSGMLGMYHLLKQDNQFIGYFAMIIIYVIFMEEFIQINQKLQNHLQIKTIQKQLNIKIAEKIHQFIFKERYFLIKQLNLKNILYLIIICLHLAQILIPPPQKLQYLYHLLFAFYSFCFNLYCFIICNGIMIETILKKIKNIQKKQV